MAIYIQGEKVIRFSKQGKCPCCKSAWAIVENKGLVCSNDICPVHVRRATGDVEHLKSFDEQLKGLRCKT